MKERLARHGAKQPRPPTQADHRYRAKVRRILSVLAHKNSHHLRDLVSGQLTPTALAAMQPSELVHDEVGGEWGKGEQTFCASH